MAINNFLSSIGSKITPALKGGVSSIKNISNPARKFSNEGERVLQSQMQKHGPGSLFLSPVTGLLKKLSPDLGAKVRYGMAAIPEAANRSVGRFFEGIPGIQRVFRRKIAPGEVGEAAHYLQSQYGYNPQQVMDLIGKAKSGQIYTHRATAPIEGIGKKFLFPLAGAAYISQALEKRKEKKHQQQLEDIAAKDRLSAVEEFAGLKKGGEALVSSQRELMAKAASRLEQLTNSNKTLQEERKVTLSKVANLENELKQAQALIELQKEAMVLVAEGTLDPSQAENWIESSMTKTSSTQNNGHIPKYAFIGELDESPNNSALISGTQKPAGLGAHQTFLNLLIS